MQRKRSIIGLFWLLTAAAVFAVLCFCGYSDGDDAYFYEYTHSMGFLEYLGWRYQTWVGRMTAEALVYVTFRLGLWFWRIVNALMLVLLPAGILRLAALAAREPEGSLMYWKESRPAVASGDSRDMGIGAALAAAAGYFLMSVWTVGYAAVWVNGSIFYTWCFTCGVWALMPFAEYLFSPEEPVWGKGGWHVSAEGCRPWKFALSVPCALIAAMSIEQMGAVLLVFELLGVWYVLAKWHRLQPLLAVQTAVTFAAFLVLFLAPGNAVRTAQEIINWMPQYAGMRFSEHLFLLVQWLLSSFANENKMFLCGIWIAGIMLLMQREKKGFWDWFLIVCAAVFTASFLLSLAGISVLSDMGLHLDITARVDAVPTAAQLTEQNLFAMGWCGAALLFTPVFLFRASGSQPVLLLAYLAGIASEAIMFFSPTMYASGARVYYLTDLLYLFVMLALSFGLSGEKSRRRYYGIVIIAAALHFLVQFPAVLHFIKF